MSDEEKSGLNRRGFLGALGAIGLAPEAIKSMVAKQVPQPTLGTYKKVVGESASNWASTVESVSDMKLLKYYFKEYKRKDYIFYNNREVIRTFAEERIKNENPALYYSAHVNDAGFNSVDESLSPFRSFAPHVNKKFMLEEKERLWGVYQDKVCHVCAEIIDEEMDKIKIKDIVNCLQVVVHLIEDFERTYPNKFKKHAMTLPNLKWVYSATEIEYEDEDDNQKSIP
jgi:hypothetical protein